MDPGHFGRIDRAKGVDGLAQLPFYLMLRMSC